MEIKVSWCYLCFALLCTSLYRGVAGSLALAGEEEHTTVVYNEGIQESYVEDIVDLKLESLREMILELKNSMTAKLEVITDLQYELNKKINEITCNVHTRRITNITKHNMTDKNNATFCGILESTFKINQRLALMENNQNVISDKLDKFENNTHREINELTDKITSLPAMLLTKKTDSVPEEITTTESRNDTSKLPPLCNVTVPASVRIDKDIWNSQRRAAEDELDKFMVNKTGCTYRALHNRESLYLPQETFDGTYEWHGAVRAREQLIIGVLWAPWTARTRYDFYVGDKNTVTAMYQRNPWTELQRRFTPGILSDERYVPVYIRIQAGTLTFGRECDKEPLFVHEVSIERGNDIRLEFFPYSEYGAKYLYDCPAGGAGQSGGY